MAGGSWRTLLSSALVVLAVLLIATQILAGDLIVPLLVFAVLFAVFAVLVRRMAARWLVVVVIVTVIAYLAAAFPFFAADLSHPESAATFIPAELSLLAALSVIAGAIGVLVGSTSKAPRTIAVVAAVLGLAGIVWGTVATSGVADDEQQPGDVAVEVRDIAFPATVQIPAGGAGVFVTNADPFRHTFVVEGQDVHQELPAAAHRRFEVSLPAGTYELHCDIPGHEQMTAELVVQ